MEINEDMQGMRGYVDEELLDQNMIPGNNPPLRRVSFPENDTELVTGYLEPLDPFRLARNVDKQELLKAYEDSCLRHNTSPVTTVLEQIQNFDIDNERLDKFTLNTSTLTCDECESLEEVLKRVQFKYIFLMGSGLTDEIAYSLFEMFEYYESTVHLDMVCDSSIGIRGCQAAARYLKKSNSLEEFSAHHMKLSDIEIELFFRPLNATLNLQILKLSNCNMFGTHLNILVNAVSANKTIKELYLPHNKLGPADAKSLGLLLKANRKIQVLDLSNNLIQDSGLEQLVTGLSLQEIREGLEVLVLWNNQLTDACAPSVQWLLEHYPNCTVVNVGCNELCDSFVACLKDILRTNKSLQRLGLQSTELTCTSTEILGEILKENTTIERIDLRENEILVRGMQALLSSLEINQTVIQIDLNEFPSVPESLHCADLIKEIELKCEANLRRQVTPSQVSTHRPASRKISLTCQYLHQESFPVSPLLGEPKKVGKLRSPAPSPIPSPVSSPLPMITKSRFSVSRVSEPANDCHVSQAFSRFKVTVVESPKSVISNSGAVTIGFDCQNSANSNSSPNLAASLRASVSSAAVSQDSDKPSDKACSLQNNCFHRPDETVKPLAVIEPSAQCERIVMQNISVPPKTEEKPMTSLEKLLSLFQAPTNLFNRSNQQNPNDKKESLIKPKTQLFSNPCDNINFFSFSNTNISKPMSNIANISDLDAQSVKQNISPQHSVSLFSLKSKPHDDFQDKLSCHQSALDSRDVGVSKGKADFVQLCSSSEESDNGVTGLESSISSLCVTDSALGDGTVTTYNSPDGQKSGSSESDLTNNNSWKPANNNEDLDGHVVIPQDGITGWQSEND